MLGVSKAVAEEAVSTATAVSEEQVRAEISDWNIVNEEPVSPKSECSHGSPTGYYYVHDDELNPPFPNM